MVRMLRMEYLLEEARGLGLPLTEKRAILRGYLQTIILNYLSEISEKELKRLADQVKPFLFKEDDIELILKAPQYGKKFLSRY